MPFLGNMLVPWRVSGFPPTSLQVWQVVKIPSLFTNDSDQKMAKFQLRNAGTLSIGGGGEAEWTGYRNQAIFCGPVFVLTLARSSLKRDMPNKYPLCKVHMGLIIKGTIPSVPPCSL